MMLEDVGQLDTLLDLGGVRRHVPLSPSTITRRVSEGLFPQPLRIGNRKLWRASAIAQYIADLQPVIHA